MSWIGIALASTVVMAVVNTIDSHLLSKRMSSLRAYLLPNAVIYLLISPVILWMVPSAGLSFGPVMSAIVSGAARMTSVWILLYLLRTQDVSKVIPVVYTYPVFVALAAMPLLGESLDLIKWIAILIIVTGAVLASIKKGRSGATGFPVKIFLALAAISLLFAVADLSGKMALNHMPFWSVFAITNMMVGGGFLIASLRRETFQQLLSLPGRNRVLTLLCFNQFLAGFGVLLAFIAMSLGPVSLVSTVISSRPVFVTLIAMASSYILPEFLVRDAARSLLALRIVAAFIIVGGITLIYLG